MPDDVGRTIHTSYYNDDTITTTYENEKELQNEFVHKKLKGRSFALVDENNRIVTPHEYLLLKSRNG